MSKSLPPFLACLLAAFVLSAGHAPARAQDKDNATQPPAVTKQPTQQNLFQAVLAFMEKDDWKPAQIPGKTVLRAYFKGSNEFWMVIVNVREPARQVAVYSIPQDKVPPALRTAAAEYITRANYGLNIGNFEMDFEDGEIRFKTSIDLEGGILTDKMIANLLGANCLIFDKYLPGLRQVLAGKPPLEVIKAIEGKK